MPADISPGRIFIILSRPKNCLATFYCTPIILNSYICFLIAQDGTVKSIDFPHYCIGETKRDHLYALFVAMKACLDEKALMICCTS